MRRFAASLLAAAALGCGDDPSGPGRSGNPTALVIAPGAVLFTTPGQTHVLSAYEIDEDGDSTAVQATYQSTNSAVVSVDADGVAAGGNTIGSAQIVAQSGDLVSAPILVVRATPAAGALLVDDSQVAGPIEPLGTREEYGPGWRYRVRLTGVSPTPGQIVLASGGAMVAGRVVSAAADGTTELELVAIGNLFDELVVDETLSLEQVRPVLTPTASLHLERVPSHRHIRLTPRGGTWVPRGVRGGAVDTEFTVGPFECKAEGEIGQEGFALDAGDLTLDPSFALEVNLTAAGVQRLAAVGGASFAQTLKPRLTPTATGKVECHAEIVTIPFPIGGPLSFFIGGLLPVGAGMRLGGELSVPNVGADIVLDASAQVAVGIDCVGGCHPLLEITGDADESSFALVLPSQLGTAGRLKLSAGGFGRVEFAVGNALLNEFQYEVAVVKLGATQELDLATREGQAADPAYASSFSLQPLVYGGTKSGADSLGFLGLELPALEYAPDLPALDSSPTGTFTIAPSSVQAGDETQLGDMATFTVTLSDVNYVGIQAVEAVEIRWLQTDGAVITLEPGRPGCSDLAAADDQLTFTCATDFFAEHVGQQTFHAYIRTRIFGVPLPVALEAGPDASARVTVTPAGQTGIVALTEFGVAANARNAYGGVGETCTDNDAIESTTTPSPQGTLGVTCSSSGGGLTGGANGNTTHSLTTGTAGLTVIDIGSDASATAAQTGADPEAGGFTEASVFTQVRFEVLVETDVTLTGQLQATIPNVSGDGEAVASFALALLGTGSIVYERAGRVNDQDPIEPNRSLDRTLRLVPGVYVLELQSQAEARVHKDLTSDGVSSAASVRLTVP